MDTPTKIILATIFSIIVCVDIITYLIRVEKLQSKTEKRLFFFQTLSNVLFLCIIVVMFQLIAEIFTIVHTL